MEMHADISDLMLDQDINVPGNEDLCIRSVRPTHSYSAEVFGLANENPATAGLGHPLPGGPDGCT
jgi:hypothetical protein